MKVPLRHTRNLKAIAAFVCTIVDESVINTSFQCRTGLEITIFSYYVV